MIPAPVRREVTGGRVGTGAALEFAAAPGLEATAATLGELFAPHAVPPVRVSLGFAEVDGYRLALEATGVRCAGRTAEDVFHAGVSALQLLLEDPVCQVVEDRARFGWRGLMVDPARCFLTVSELRRIVDVAALYKLNVLHLHLTDDEAWLLPPDGYSEQEYLALQEYAAARHVTLVPEVDLPGHCGAAARVHPGLTSPVDPRDPRGRAFIEEVLTRAARLTAGPYVHVGGDEVVGLAPDAFREAITLARETVRRAGKIPVGWQESARAGIDLAQYWVDTGMMDLPSTQEDLDSRPELAGWTLEWVDRLRAFFAPADGDLERIANGGGKVILSPQSHLYLDRPYAESPGLGFAYRPRTVEYSASWDPSAYGLPDDRIAGVEATLFANAFSSFEEVVTMLLPRLPAVAEAAWSRQPPRWDDYRPRLARQAPLWRDRGLKAFPSAEVEWSVG